MYHMFRLMEIINSVFINCLLIIFICILIYLFLLGGIKIFVNKFTNKEENKKYKDWEKDYKDDINWEDFDENYFFCSRCKGYNKDGQCICYAR